MEIKKHEVVELNMAEIISDPDNPNIMTKEEESHLEYSFKRFGFLQPVIVARYPDGKLIYADGEHRAKIYAKFNKTKIPAIIVEVASEGERRLIRQAMNKIRGFHDPVLDSKELEIINSEGLIDDLKNLIDDFSIAGIDKIDKLNIQGNTDISVRYDLTFYFDNKEDLELAKEYFKQPRKKEPDANKLLELIRGGRP